MSGTDTYKPSWRNASKYSIYLRYFYEYLKYYDFKSLWASLRYVFTHKLPTSDFKAVSGMGKFIIRKNTTDFQFINYAYEKSIKDYLKHNIHSFDVFIDLGACIGEYCIWLAREGKYCIAVEPVNWQGLKENIALNGLQERIKVFTCGVGEKKEHVFFNIPEGVKSSSHLARNSTNDPNVEIDTLDNILSTINLPKEARILMKLDVEGMEPEAIRGAKILISTYKDLRIIYEHFLEDDYRNDKSLLEICDFSFENLDTVNRLATKK